MMKTRRLGKGGPEVSAIGLGCMGMSHAYGAARDHGEMANLIAEAVDMGYTLFDTAEVYGTPDSPHDNEILLGKALKAYRGRVVIATKYGITFAPQLQGGTRPLVPDSSPGRIRESVEGSLRRLQTDHIDIYLQHRTDRNVEPEEVADVMASLMREGKILHWGISEGDGNYIRRAHAVCPVTTIQNRYSMMARGHESLFPLLEELGIGLMAFSPLANGLLSGYYSELSQFDGRTDYRASMPQFQKDSFRKNRQLFTLLDSIAQEHHLTMTQVALAWMLNRKPYIVPIPGTRHVSRLRENMAAADVTMTAEEVASIDNALDNMSMSDVFLGSKNA